MEGEIIDIRDCDLVTLDVMLDLLAAGRPDVVRLVGRQEDLRVFEQGGVGELARNG